MTLFSWEVPIAHLKDFDLQQDYIFALSFLLEDHRYRKYICGKIWDGVTVIIDNSFNETVTPADFREVARIYREYIPTAVISPDSDDWSTQTTLVTLKDLLREIPAEAVIGVYRSDLERDLMSTYINKFAVPYEWMFTVDPRRFSDTHLLGLRDVGAVVRWQPQSLDTSWMVKLAMQGIKFEEWSGEIPHHSMAKSPMQAEQILTKAWSYFNLILSDAELELAAHNMEAFKVAVNGVPTPVPHSY